MPAVPLLRVSCDCGSTRMIPEEGGAGGQLRMRPAGTPQHAVPEFPAAEEPHLLAEWPPTCGLVDAQARVTRQQAIARAVT